MSAHIALARLACHAASVRRQRPQRNSRVCRNTTIHGDHAHTHDSAADLRVELHAALHVLIDIPHFMLGYG